MMSKYKDYPCNVFPVTKTVRVPVYSSIRYEDGKLVGEIERYMDTPIEWIQSAIERKVH